MDFNPLMDGVTFPQWPGIGTAQPVRQADNQCLFIRHNKQPLLCQWVKHCDGLSGQPPLTSHPPSLIQGLFQTGNNRLRLSLSPCQGRQVLQNRLSNVYGIPG